MKLYRTAEGKWVGTQADAGNKNIIEVPVDKPGLLEWLNENCKQNVPVAGPADDSPKPVSPSVACPRCKMTPTAAQRMADMTSLDAICERIQNSKGPAVARLMGATIERANELASGLS